ncbi:thioredoxin domain-containing protein [Wenzhouxiangella sp. AB-CW3]|uniref:thioredoxin domain-containing protein n=1 Tax=Wenzhouxiangella sp. AB-CW3 TaxID=2771012 RepID=UPI00168B10E6|nr:thioredoxin domain-containing protein [Wenzhouxiangella sp. AB-CW3]QOC22351.1 thioredoxin domain-containing protein [Wenzhouxiangella sp. AB-CW3]
MKEQKPQNRLGDALSPYLLQHADNPVHWQPWDREALAMARTLDKPILLSIGYSACHWCHVMAHECFENDDIAALMNAHFVNIKVDREERPDLDRIYQMAHQLLTGRGGGWPLTVFLDPDSQAPFFAGTYFPPEPRHGMMGFDQLLQRIHQVWATRRAELRAQHLQVQEALQAISRPQGGDQTGDQEELPDPDTLIAELSARFDADHGGFGTSPKFPQAPQLSALATFAEDDQAAQMLADTLTTMARHGLNDQLAGGFFRYCVDQAWEIPHFEKMLSDNAQLLGLYADAAVRWKRKDFERVCERTASWLDSEMGLEGGGFAASLDADTPDGEGAFYLWRPDEVDTVLHGQERELWFERYGLDGPPNFDGKLWHLVIARSIGEMVRPGLDESDIRASLDQARGKLLATRNERTRPGRDDKLIAGWNGLAIENLARSGRLLGRSDWCERAAESLDSVAVKLFGQDPPRAIWRGGRSAHPATLEDHANVLLACLELLAWRFEPRWFNLARRIARRIVDQFVDDDSSAMYLTPLEHEALLTRPLAHADDATPAGAGQAVLGLLRLGALTGDIALLRVAETTLAAASAQMRQQPLAHATLFRSAGELASPTAQVLIGGAGKTADGWHRKLAGHAGLHCYRLPPDLSVEDLPAQLEPMVHAEQATARICLGRQCLAPIDDFDLLQARLADDRRQ